jgi:hypothetical protein
MFSSVLIMSKNIHHRHGENINKMEQIPEKPIPTESPDLKTAARGSRSPSEIKRIRHQANKRRDETTANQP